MKLSDKILALRKKQGMSQEDLAEKLNVSRQAVSRWEMGSALPDASNILQLSRLFGVTADYLLNDDYENDCGISAANDSCENGRSVPVSDEIVKKPGRYRLLGWCILAAGFLGNFIIYILSRMQKVMVPRITVDESGRKWYTLSGDIKAYSYRYFIAEHSLEFLTAVLWGMIAAGLSLALILPLIRRKAKG